MKDIPDPKGVAPTLCDSEAFEDVDLALLVRPETFAMYCKSATPKFGPPSVPMRATFSKPITQGRAELLEAELAERAEVQVRIRVQGL